jgi:hypothetical protein
MSRRTGAAPKLAPTLPLAPSLVPATSGETPPTIVSLTPVVTRPDARDWTCAVEAIRTMCGRVVERTAVVAQLKVQRNAFRDDPIQIIQSVSHDNTYRLWEPVLEGAEYGATRRNEQGRVWGLAHTRKPRERIVEQREAVAWEMQQEARAVAVIRATCAEVGKGLAEGVFEVCGIVRLIGNPKIRAQQNEATRRARPC